MIINVLLTIISYIGLGILFVRYGSWVTGDAASDDEMETGFIVIFWPFFAVVFIILGSVYVIGKLATLKK